MILASATRRAATARAVLTKAFAVAITGLSGCSTPSCAPATYVPHGPDGGYRELPFGDDVVEVRYQWSSVAVRRNTASDFALLRAAEVALARGAGAFCIEGLQVFHGQLDDWPESLEYAAYTIRTFEAAQPDREIATSGATAPALHACYEPVKTARQLRMEHGIAPEIANPAPAEDREP